jgi:patatin-like phospholipase/acyl hydrolase
MKYLLSVTGGGIRVIIALQFLKNLEEHLGKTTFELFDFFAGTSAGGMLVS